MKKVLGILMISALTISATAQKTYIQGGLNLANITKTEDGQTQDNNILPTFNVGIMHQFSLSPVIGLETGLLFEGKGAKAETYFTSSTDNNYIKSKFNPLYFQVPLNLLLKVPMGAGSQLYFNAGPYAAIGVAGKSKTESKILGVNSTSESNIKFTSTDPNVDDGAYDKLKRFDFGLNFGAGIALKHLIIKANYGLGLTKINSTETNNNANDKNKYRTVSISVGIPIGK